MRVIRVNTQTLGAAANPAVLLPVVALCLTAWTYLHVQIPVATNEQPGYLEHLARRGRSAENSLAWSVSDKSSRGAALIELLCDGTTSKVLIAASASETAVKEAIAAATGKAVGAFYLTGGRSEIISLSWDALTDGAQYTVKAYTAPDRQPQPDLNAHNHEHEHEHEHDRGSRDASAAVLGLGSAGSQQPLHDGAVVLTQKPARLPRVVLACLGTARYRGIAISALESARDKFGGDSLVSLHLLTDNVSGVDPTFNPAYAPYREWPESGLSKFEDILAGIGDVVRAADYFFFLDGDVRFNEDVPLSDVAADLTAVEHPFYPRYVMGFCTPDNKAGRGFCGYPYDRNPKSQIQIPEGSGKYFVKIDDPKAKPNGYYYIVRANSWYIQSAFWGGKSKFVVPMLEDLAARVNIDRSHNIYSQVVQDERYVNWYLWKHGNDSEINIRILKPSYLYPYNAQGFGDHIKLSARPIIVHGTKKAGKMIKGEAEIRLADSTICFDNFIKDKIGTYGCHPTESKGGSQGFIWSDGRIRVAYGKSDHPDAKTCVDGTGVKPGEPLPTGNKCEPDNKGQLWDWDPSTKLLRNEGTGLCVDSMRHDTAVYPQAAKENRWPVSMQQCGKSAKQKLDISFVSLDESLLAGKNKRAARAGN